MLNILMVILVIKISVQGFRFLYIIKGKTFKNFKQANESLWEVSSSLSAFKEFLLDLVIFLQLFEFLVIIRLIRQQRHKNLQQLYYDHNNREIQNRLFKWFAHKQDNQNCFLKDEIWVYLIFLFTTLAFSVFEIVLEAEDTMNDKEYFVILTRTHGVILSIVSAIIYLLFAVSFCILYKLLKKYHLFEF